MRVKAASCIIALLLSTTFQSYAVADPDWLRELRRKHEAENRCHQSGGSWDGIRETCKLPDGGSSSGSSSSSAFGAAVLLLLGIAAYQAFSSSGSTAKTAPADRPPPGGSTRTDTPEPETNAALDVAPFVMARVSHPDGHPLNMRDGPGLDFTTVMEMPGNARGLRVYGCDAHDGERAWCRVTYSGRSGWASAKYLARDRMEEVDLLLRPGMTVTGIAGDQNGRKEWPFALIVERTASADGAFSGRIYWPTLKSVNAIRGRVSGYGVDFREVGYIQRGGAILGCSYRLRQHEDLSLRGGYDCGRDGRGFALMR